MYNKCASKDGLANKIMKFQAKIILPSIFNSNACISEFEMCMYIFTYVCIQFELNFKIK